MDLSQSIWPLQTFLIVLHHVNQVVHILIGVERYLINANKFRNPDLTIGTRESEG